MIPDSPDSEAPTREISSARLTQSVTLTFVPGRPSATDEIAGLDPHLPRQFGNYELLHVAGEGGMGIVYQARHLESQHIVALKLIRPSHLFAPDHILRFRREMRIAEMLRHENIARVFEVGQFDGQYFFTMSYAPTTLARQRHRFALPRAAAELAITLARALHYAHGLGVIHRDLKPGNILLTSTDKPLITDFGLARWVDASMELTSANVLGLGTPAYMSPEQVSSPSSLLGPSVDQWALGVMLFELITGQRPFVGDNNQAILHQVCKGATPRMCWFLPDVDPALEAVVLKALHKVPSARYPSCAAMAEDLQAWLDGRNVQARIEPSTVRSQALPERARPRRVGSTAAIGGLLAVPAFLFFGGWMDPVKEAPAAAAVRLNGGGEVEPDWSSGIATEIKREWLEKRLDQGQAVELVPRHGWPRWYKFLNNLSNFSRVEGEPKRRGFQISHPALGLLALAADPRGSDFRFESRIVQTEQINNRASVGLFCGFSRAQFERRLYSCALCWQINDLGISQMGFTAEDRERGKDKNLASLSLVFLKQDEMIGRVYLNQFDWKPQFDPVGPVAPETRAGRHLSMELHPRRLRVSLDGQSVGTIPVFEIEMAIENWLRSRDLPHDLLAFQPRAALGIAIEGASASVYSTVLTPLAREK